MKRVSTLVGTYHTCTRLYHNTYVQNKMCKVEFLNGEKIHCIRLADNNASVSESEKYTGNSLTTLIKILQENQMKINVNKTKKKWW